MISDKKYIELNNTHLRTAEENAQRVEYNKWLISEYPFLMPYNRWTGDVSEDYDYSWTELDDMPDGWRIAFGLKMCQEIKEALLHAQELDPAGGYKESYITTNYDSDRILPYLEGYRITQIKEKYGRLCWYSGSAPAEVHHIVSKYERISETVCLRCGAPAEYISRNWISPWCGQCKDIMESRIQDIFDPIEEIKL